MFRTKTGIAHSVTGIRVPSNLWNNDAEELARSAGLTYLTDQEPGWTRRRWGKGFSYYDQRGARVTGSERERLSRLMIPPAWTDVWLAPSADSYLLATGRDEAERKQYRYHEEFQELQERRKFQRLAYFPRALRRLRPQVDEIIANETVGSKRFALAVATRLIDRSLLRVGSRSHERTSGARGATTLHAEEATVAEGAKVFLDFTGKGGSERHVDLIDPVLASAIEDLIEHDHPYLFTYEFDGETVPISSAQLNSFIADRIGPAFSARDFRTWGGSVAAVEELASGGTEIDGVDAAAEVLGNSRAVARSSYVAPMIATAAESGELQRLWTRSRRSEWLSRAESTTGKVLATGLPRS